MKIWKYVRLPEHYTVLSLNRLTKKGFELKCQIKRSSGSGMDNIAEGFERAGNKEFVQFLFIRKASVGEVKSQL
ncbi:MAG: four helix bundle protein [Bacteroidales bacterium]|nr:four helix bundle protein [Bacteroidales bacterium]